MDYHALFQNAPDAILIADEQFRLREQFVAGLSHDLRTPLSAARLACA